VLFQRDGALAVVPLTDPQAAPAPAPFTCDRVDFVKGLGVCLTPRRNIISPSQAVVFDRNFTTVHTLGIPGLPSRVRMSPDGRWAAVTSFVTGDSYTAEFFSTRTVILDVERGEAAHDLERFTVSKDGRRTSEVDFNFWGVTFTTDSNRFYATLGTAQHRYLVEGDLTARTMNVLRDDVECPSLSPDGRRVAFKRRVPGGLRPRHLAAVRPRPPDPRRARRRREGRQELHGHNRIVAIDLEVPGQDPGQPSPGMSPDDDRRSTVDPLDEINGPKGSDRRSSIPLRCGWSSTSIGRVCRSGPSSQHVPLGRAPKWRTAASWQRLSDWPRYQKAGATVRRMSVVEVVDDLLTLQELVDRESDVRSREALAVLQRRVAGRDKGAKVSDAAMILGLSAPTIRSWIDAGVLPVTATAPVRVDLLALADAKRVVEGLRRRSDERQLLAEVLRLVRDRAVLAPPDVAEGVADMRAGQTTRLDQALLDELLPVRERASRPRPATKRVRRSTST